MKFEYFFVYLYFQIIGTSVCFILYPFGAQNFLTKFYRSLNLDSTKFNINVLKNSIPGELCNRHCTLHDTKICYFKFTLEFYQTLGGACNNCLKSNNTDCFNEQCIIGDGTERTFMSINRQLPGPAIQVCKNDIVIVDVDNQMEGTATSIHWHGLLQYDTPYSDGVPFITQCPVSYSTSFRYIFYAKQKGTYLYHSHSGQHKANGIYGALIVRDDDEDNDMKNLYDFDLPDFYILCSDWMHVQAEDYFPGLPSKISLFDSILINGYGRYLNKTTQTRVNAPIKIFTVQRHKRYRFRLINAASNVCPFHLQIENHNIMIIAADGNDIEPISADTLFITSGERFDFIVNTTSVIDDYFIRVRALPPCNDTIEDFAVLRYGNGDDTNKIKVDFIDRKIPKTTEIYETKRFFNFPGENGHLKEILVGRSKNVKNEVVDAKSDNVFYLFLSTPQLDNKMLFRKGNHLRYMVTSNKLNNNNAGAINNIIFTLPNFPLMLHGKSINESIFCDASTMKNCMHNSLLCECIHRIKVKLNSLVEFVLIDIDDNSRHPFHLHGHKFYVMDMGKFNGTNEDVVEVLKDRIGYLMPIMKDTVTIPNDGFVRIKFRADNPGFWLAHCHFDYHLAVGMGFVLQVGELNEMKEPPTGLSKNCNNYMPENMEI